jgi:hypothetical protein
MSLDQISRRASFCHAILRRINVVDGRDFRFLMQFYLIPFQFLQHYIARPRIPSYFKENSRIDRWKADAESGDQDQRSLYSLKDLPLLIWGSRLEFR